VFGNAYSRAEACDEASHDEIGGVGASRGGSEIGEAHGHLCVGDGSTAGCVGYGGGGLGCGGEGYVGGVDGGCEFTSEGVV